MKQAITEYKQAIIIGASPMGSEESALLKLLKWAGYGEQAEHCSRDCDTCHTGCSAKIKNKDIYVVVADGGLKFLLKNGMLPDFFVGDLDSVELEGALKDILKDIPKEIVPVEKDDTDMALAVAKAYENFAVRRMRRCADFAHTCKYPDDELLCEERLLSPNARRRRPLGNSAQRQQDAFRCHEGKHFRYLPE